MKMLTRKKAVAAMVDLIDYEMECKPIVTYASLIVGMGDEWAKFLPGEDVSEVNDLDVMIDIIHEAVRKLNIVSFYILSDGSDNCHEDTRGRYWVASKRVKIGTPDYFEINLEHVSE